MANPREKKPVTHTKKHIARLERERRQTRLILFSFFGVLAVVVGLIIYGYLDIHYLQSLRPIAKVGDTKISIGEWQARVRLQRTQLINQASQYLQYAQYFGIDVTQQLTKIQGQLDASTSLGQTVLDDMIDEELIRQEAAKRGIKLDTNRVTQLVHSSFNYYPNGTSTPTITPTPVNFPTLSPDTLALVTLTPTPTQFMTETPTPTPTPNSLFSPTPTSPPTATPTLTPTATAGPSPTPSPTSTPYTLKGFQDQYQQSITQVATETGLNETQFHQLFADTVLRKQLEDVITADAPHVQDQVWARHILVKDEATAKAVRQRLINGEDFAKVAAEVSIDTGTKNKGGDLGWFPRKADAMPNQTTMVPEFEKAAFSLKVGEISEPVKTQYGYHIIQVLAHEKVPLDAQTYQQGKDAIFADWLQNARKTYNVVTYENWQSIVPTEPTLPPSLQVQPTP